MRRLPQIDRELLNRLKRRRGRPALSDDVRATQVALRRWLWRLWRLSGELAALSAEPGGDRLEVETVTRFLLDAYQLANRGVPYEVCQCQFHDPKQREDIQCSECDGMKWISVGQSLRASIFAFEPLCVEFLPVNPPLSR